MPSGYPQRFEAAATSSKTSTLTWDPPNFEDRNGIIIDYVINITSAHTNETTEYASNTTTLTLTTLSPYTTYYCIVAARTSVGTGPFSSVLRFQTPPDGKQFFKAYCVSISTNTVLNSFQFHLALPRPHMELL